MTAQIAVINFMEQKKKKRTSSCKSQASRHQKQCYPFTDRTRLFDVIKAVYHPELAEWLKKIAPYLKQPTPDWKTVRRLDFNCDTNQAATCISWLLMAIGRKYGLNYKMSVFFRYITSIEHSNLRVDAYYFNLLVNNIIRYEENKQNAK